MGTDAFLLFLRTHIHCLRTRNCSRKSLKPNIEKKGAAHIVVDNSLIKKVILLSQSYQSLRNWTVKWRISGASHSMATPREMDSRRS